MNIPELFHTQGINSLDNSNIPKGSYQANYDIKLFLDMSRICLK